MSRLSLILLFALLSISLASPFTIRQKKKRIRPEPFESPEPSESPEESMEPSPSLESEDDEVCVDQKYLLARHARHELVHRIPLLASALCPGGGLPCGTANHMVRVNSKTLSYRQLCESRECVKRNMLVNSVLSHIWEEVEHDGVTLTMFDSRHPELPQKVLHWTIMQKRRVFG